MFILGIAFMVPQITAAFTYLLLISMGIYYASIEFALPLVSMGFMYLSGKQTIDK
jgi:hypothetical protein